MSTFRQHYRTAPSRSTEALRSIGLAVFMVCMFGAAVYQWWFS